MSPIEKCSHKIRACPVTTSVFPTEYAKVMVILVSHALNFSLLEHLSETTVWTLPAP